MKFKSKLAWRFVSLAVCSATVALAGESKAPPGHKEQKAPPAPPQSKQSTEPKQPDSGSVRLSELLEARFTGAGGKELGAVADLLIDTKNGNIDFAILVRPVASPDPGVRLVPVPWTAINVQPERAFTLNVDRNKMQETPGMEEPSSELDEADSGITIFRFFGVEPPAEGGGESPGGMFRGEGRGGSAGPPFTPRVRKPSDSKGFDI